MTENKRGLPELLAPCGSPEALRAAIAGGADAVYFGGTLFNARMNAKNFGRQAIKDAVDLCHENGVRAYITLNTLVLDREMAEAVEYASFLYKCGADALITADAGLAKLIREYIPDFELHASTQMTGHSSAAARELHAAGFSRMVCAREMSAEQIKRLAAESPLEIEMFVHGAICVSCSGQCLMSAMLGGRSGNRGMCAQPCRMPYNGAYPISLKDMCLANHIPELTESGVASLKIEGRMKSPEYVYGVTRIYRRLLDERRNASSAEMAELTKLFSRGGFTDGYYTGRKDSSMLGIRSEQEITQSRELQYKKDLKSSGRLPKIELSERSLPETQYKPVISKNIRGSYEKPINTARFVTAKQIPDTDYFDILYLPLSVTSRGLANGVLLPPVIFDDRKDDARRALESAAKAGAAHIMISNIGQLELAREFGLIPHGDFRLNIFNTLSARYYTETLPDFDSLILSPELTLPQIRDITTGTDARKGAIVYGRIPLMLLEKPVGQQQLRDRKGARFPILRDSGRDIVYNSVPLYMADHQKKLSDAGISERHFVFSCEDRAETLRIIYAYSHNLPAKEREQIRRIK